MSLVRILLPALGLSLGLMVLTACGDEEGTTPKCDKPDASDCFTQLPDAAPAGDASTD